jgi:hypothetical protein
MATLLETVCRIDGDRKEVEYRSNPNPFAVSSYEPESPSQREGKEIHR